MKKIFCFSLILFSTVIFSQKQAIKKIKNSSAEVEIYTEGLDDLVIENSKNKFIEILLFSENLEKHHIIVKENSTITKLSFNTKNIQVKETVFRKFITKGLHRTNAIIKIPKDKSVTVFGENIDIESKNFKNKLKIFIERGILKLNTIKHNVTAKLYSGSVYAKVKKMNLNLKSKDGKIKIDSTFYNKKYVKQNKDFIHDFNITSLKANIFLTTK